MNAPQRNQKKSGSARFALLMAMLCLFLISPLVSAQEKKQQFLVRDAQGASHGVYDTQVQAEAAIKAIPGAENMEDAYQYVDTIKSTILREEGKTLITYWMGRTKAKDEEWTYGAWQTSKIPTEEQAAVALAQEISATRPSCPSASVAPAGPWTATFGPFPEYCHQHF
ncbi:hypothetical protein [Xanthomonas citri]|uniref:hypothetical protein n=1 Tax=Xanthomonas citri TaxID=346 RepID=UPI0018E054C6|nr:hypothetical protein [Xanthomonas citri]